MPRAYFADTIKDPDGNPLSGASIRVEQQGTDTLITEIMYDSPSGGNVLTNPLTSDATGAFSFYLDVTKTVELSISKGSYSTRQLNVYVSVGASHLFATDPPYSADSNGVADSSSAIQSLLDDL